MSDSDHGGIEKATVILEEIGIYSQIVLYIALTLLLIFNLWTYRKCQHDKISIIALFLFEFSFLLEIIVTLIEWTRISDFDNQAFNLFASIVVPATYAVTVSTLYFFIFEIERIRLLLTL